MAKVFIVILLLTIAQNAFCKPVKESQQNLKAVRTRTENNDLTMHAFHRRYINLDFTHGVFSEPLSLNRRRTKRGAADDCEKLQLCKMHAEAGHNLFSAYQEYFVSKENAHLWDHVPRSAGECESKFTCSQDSRVSKDTQDSKISQDTQDSEVSQDIQDSEVSQDTQDSQDSEDSDDY